MKLPAKGDWVKAWPDGESVEGIVTLVDERNRTFVIQDADLVTWGINSKATMWREIK